MTNAWLVPPLVHVADSGSAPIDLGDVVSVNVSQPRIVLWRGQAVSTGIYKEPIAGRVRVRTFGLEGDRQADPRFHGGPTKAVYAYPSEHYPFWRAEYPDIDMDWGMFGENLTTTGLREDDVRIGDRLRFGTAVLVVTQPRMPCYKLGIKFGRKDVIERFLESRRSGIYFSVRREGDVAAEDTIELLQRSEDMPTVTQVVASSDHADDDG